MKKGRISTITILIIVFIVLLLIVIFIPKQRNASSNKKINEISSPEDFKNEKQAIEFAGSKYIGQKNNRIYLSFKYPLYSNDKSNQKYYMQLLNYVATVKDYSNFILIDEEKNIDIEVRCDSKKQIIEDYKICGLNNYFGMADSNIAIKNYKKIDNTELNIQSPVITNIMNNNWQFNGLNIGTEESSIDGYRIFFDEGYDVKVIETDNMQPKVFNIVFNTRYTSNVVNGLNTKSTIEDVRSKLGKPTFDKEEAGVIGYKSNKIYAFFAKTQNGLEISIYNVENVDTSKFSEAVSEFLTEKKYNLFIDIVLNIWEDADVYEMQDDYVLLQYSTKGIKIEFNTSNPSGITICSNFKGNITEETNTEQIMEG